ncbi:MAG: ArsR/SmtB family transcription factor [Vicinamibacterales bacterium]
MSVDVALAALADPTRRALFEKLTAQGPLPVGTLAAGAGVSRPAVSQHLSVLKSAGLVREERVGTRRIYRVEVEGVVALRRYLDAMWGTALEALKAHASSVSPACGPVATHVRKASRVGNRPKARRAKR